MNIIGLAKVTSQGQVTIPKTVRDKLKLKEGDKVLFIQGDEHQSDVFIVKSEKEPSKKC